MMLLSVIVTVLLLKCLSIQGSDFGGWQNGISNHLTLGNDVQDLSALASLGGSGGWHNIGSISTGGGGWNQLHHTHSLPIHEHVEISKSILVPVIKNIGVPVAQPIKIPVAHVTAIGVPQPYPVQVPIAQPVAIPVIKTIATIVEKKVPVPIEKIIPVPVEKPVPITIEKLIPVAVEKPYPVHVPIYKHVFHRQRSHGWHYRDR